MWSHRMPIPPPTEGLSDFWPSCLFLAHSLGFPHYEEYWYFLITKVLNSNKVAKLGFRDRCWMSHMFMFVRLLCKHSRVLLSLTKFPVVTLQQRLSLNWDSASLFCFCIALCVRLGFRTVVRLCKESWN